MALTCDVTTKHGLSLAGAYVRVTYLHGDKEKLDIEYAVYPTKELRDLNKEPVEVKNVVVDLDLNFNGNHFNFAYKKLKELDDLSSAVDV